MYVSVHPTETMLRGDGHGYNPRDIFVTPLPGRRELITGVFRDDGARSGPRRPDRRFRITMPTGFGAWQSLNTRVFYALRDKCLRCRNHNGMNRRCARR